MYTQFQISCNNWLETTLKTLLKTDLDLLLPFKQNWIRLGPA